MVEFASPREDAGSAGERSVRVRNVGLIVFGVAAIDGEARSEARDYFRSAWDACARLDITAPIESLGVSTELEWPSPNSDFGQLELLGARQRLGGGEAAYQAIAFAVHDSVAFVTMLAPNRRGDVLATWDELSREWSRAGGPPEPPAAVLGEARLFTAVCSLDRERVATMGDAVQQAVPNVGDQRCVPPFRTAENVFLWELDRTADRSTFAALASEDDERALDGWTWWDNDVGIAGLERGLVHLLLNVFKFRGQHRIYERRSAHLRAAGREVDGALKDLLEFLDGPGDRLRARSSTGELVAFQDVVSQQQARSGGLLFQESKLRELRQTVKAAGVNMELLAPAAHERSPGILFGRDFALAARLPEQIDLELGYARAVQDRALVAHRLTASRLQQGLEHQGREQARLTLFQTSLLGALLAAVGAIATFKMHVELTSRVRPPTIAVLSGAVLALPLLIVNWAERYRPVEYSLAGAWGASWGWLIARIVAVSWPLQLAASLAGAFLLALAAWMLESRVASRTRPWLRRGAAGS